MKRLTIKGATEPVCARECEYGSSLDCYDCDKHKELLNRLAAYEDTGLEPAEIAELKEDLDFAAAANAELYYALPHWISVKEGLPEKGKPVLVYGKRGGIYTALFEGGKYWWKLNSKSHSCEPTHWMPLPEPPPKEGRE